MNTISIRRRLFINSLVILGILTVFLALHFTAARNLSGTFAHVDAHEVRPERDLRDMIEIAERIHTRMLRVLLSHTSSEGALYELEEHQRQLNQKWEHFLANHRVATADPNELALVQSIASDLPRLHQTLERMALAYRIYDPVELTRIAKDEWFDLAGSVLYNLSELATMQRGHAQLAYEGLVDDFNRTAAVLGTLLVLGVLLVGVLSYRLNRHVNRKIHSVEQSLAAVAAGDLAATVPGESGTEIGRIAEAINGTLAMLRADRSAIGDLMARNEAILHSMTDGLCGVDQDGVIMFANPAACALLGHDALELVGRPARQALQGQTHGDASEPPGTWGPLVTLQTGCVIQGSDQVFVRKDGSSFPVEYTSAPMLGTDPPGATIVVFRDITARRHQEQLLQEANTRLQQSNAELKATQSQLLQSEKMASVGQLAAGVAHEINNPVGFVNSNLGTLKTYVERLLLVIDTYGKFEQRLADDPSAMQSLIAAKEEADLAYLRDDVLELLRESQDGLARVKRIVADLKDFSHVDQTEWQVVDLNAGLESTLNVVWNELKYKAEIIRAFGPIPPVRCLAGQLNQVFMNLLINAAHAIDTRGTITLTTRQEGDDVIIQVADSGHGIPSDVLPRIFDPFFTTKPVGKGTGLGLSIAWDIVAKHTGRITVDSTPGVGTVFTLRLPINGPATMDVEVAHG